VARNHALTGGGKRRALAAAIAFYGVNGRRLTPTNDEACELIMNVAEGKLDSVDDIAAVLAMATKPTSMTPTPITCGRRRRPDVGSGSGRPSSCSVLGLVARGAMSGMIASWTSVFPPTPSAAIAR